MNDKAVQQDNGGAGFVSIPQKQPAQGQFQKRSFTSGDTPRNVRG
jgi:hypothetical protein